MTEYRDLPKWIQDLWHTDKFIAEYAEKLYTENERLKSELVEANGRRVVLYEALEKAKCCGSCKWYLALQRVCCNDRSELPNNGLWPECKCDKWEVRE